MKLVQIAQYLFVKNRNDAAIFFLLIFLLFSSQTRAQSLSIFFDNIPLSEALIKSSEKFNIKVAFDAQKLKSVIVHKEVTGSTPSKFLENLLLGTGFEFQLKHGSYLIVDANSENKEPLLQQCQMVGSLSDKETGEQLPFASIVFFNQSQNLSTAASSSGTFSIKNIVSNPVRVMVNLIGYYPVDTMLSWSGPQLFCDFKLSRKVQMMDTVVVKETKVEMVDFRNDVDFATTINPAKLIDLPVLAETDIFKTLQLLPGISYSENSSELSIRGGSSDQNLILFDGQTLYNLSHYYGVISSLNPNIIKDIQVYKGGYDSRYGERVSGIVDITGKSGNQLKPTIYGDLNLVSGNLTAEIPIGKKLTIIAAGRRSYSDIYSTSFAEGLFNTNSVNFHRDSSHIVNQTKPTFRFYDYNTKVSYRINNTENLSVSVYGGKDFYENAYTGNTNTLNVNTSDKNNWSNYGISSSWMKQWNSTFYSNFQLGYSGYSNEYTNLTDVLRTKNTINQHGLLPNETNQFNTLNKNNLNDFSVSLRNIYSISNNNQLNFGFGIRRNSIYYYKDAGMEYVYDNMEKSAWTSSVYLQDRITFSNKLTLKPGLRLNFYNGNNKFYVEPRFSANYRFSNKFSIRMATGRYCQFISQVLSPQETGYTKNFWVLADNSVHPVVTSNHFIIGSTLEFGNFLVDAEAYYKKYSGLQEYLFVSPYLKNADFPNYFPPKKPQSFGDQMQQPSSYIVGEGKSYGADFFIRYKRKNYTSWVSYSVSRSLHQFSMINNNSDIPAPTDQIHQLSFTNMITIRNWNLGSITLFSTGKPYIDNVLFENNLPTIRYYKRLPNYSRSDISINYNFKVGNARIKAGATLINIFNSQNYFDVNTRKFDFENSSFAETTLIQSLDLSVNFFIHFVL